MRVLDRVVGVFWWKRGDGDEERRWKASGSFPTVVEREYRTRRQFRRDDGHLKAMGYRVAQVGHGGDPSVAGGSFRGLAIAEDPQGGQTWVRYERADGNLMARRRSGQSRHDEAAFQPAPEPPTTTGFDRLGIRRIDFG